MYEKPQITMSEFQEALASGSIRILQIIQAVFGLGVLFFGIVVFVLYLKIAKEPGREVKNDLSLINILTVVHVVVAFVDYTAAYFVYRFIVSHKALVKRLNNDSFVPAAPEKTPAKRCLTLIINGALARLVIYQGIAYFGMVVCLIGVTSGIIKDHPEYWFNMLSAAIMILLALNTFPTRERIENIFRNRISDLP